MTTSASSSEPTARWWTWSAAWMSEAARRWLGYGWALMWTFSGRARLGMGPHDSFGSGRRACGKSPPCPRAPSPKASGELPAPAVQRPVVALRRDGRRVLRDGVWLPEQPAAGLGGQG